VTQARKVQLCTWESSAPGVKASGVSGDPDDACRAAQEWMRDNGAQVARLELVELVVGAASLVPAYQPTGAAWHVTAARAGNPGGWISGSCSTGGTLPA
jgi:hypothetical protein